MTNSFNNSQRAYFDAEDGAYSPISKKDEETKSQITLTGHEKNVVIAHFGKTIFVGKISDSQGKGRKKFIHQNTGKTISLGLVFPKKGSNELRLYMSGEFKGTAEDIWYVFKREGALYVGTMPLMQWDEIGKNDLEDSSYQQAIQLYQEVPAAQKETINLSFPRSAKVALAALVKAKFECEYDRAHETFTTLAGKKYMEAHHILPIARQGEFKVNIDIIDNIASLCPTCHRLIHYGTKPAKRVLLKKTV